MTNTNQDNNSTNVNNEPTNNEPTYISIDDVMKVEIKLGQVKECEIVDGSEKLYKLKVDFGEKDIDGTNKYRTVFSGIRMFVSVEELLFRQFPFITNLKPRKIMGEYSEAMILAADEEIMIENGEKLEKLTLLSPNKEMSNGIRFH
ncbi:MAG: hypothetical protein QM532_04295 [Cyanobium sp. MAG06]|nr:hypothetical protein [Cyanobium sp. MAG06]